MELTQEQQNMLDGKYGEGTAYAMKIQVAIGESSDGAHNKGTCSFVQSGRGFVVCREIAECRSILQSLSHCESGILYFVL